MKIHLHIMRARIEETYAEIDIGDASEFTDIASAIKAKLPEVIADPTNEWIQTEIVPVAAEAVRKPDDDEEVSKPCQCPICRTIGQGNTGVFANTDFRGNEKPGKRKLNDA